MQDNAGHMRALVFKAPASDGRQSRVAELPIPIPAADQVTIDVEHAGINFKDVMSRRGDLGYVDAWPFVPGLEVAGRIRAVGDSVSDLHPGDLVSAYTGQGGLAEVALAKAALVVPVPEGLSLEKASVAPGALATASLLIVERGRLQRGESVLVHGATGGVGQAAARLARQAGAAQVIGTVGHVSRTGKAQDLGYDAILPRDDRLTEELHRLTSGRGVDLVLDPQGTDQLPLDLSVAAPGGRVILFGNASGGALAPLPHAGVLFAGNASIAGFSLASLAASSPTTLATAIKRVLRALREGLLNVEVTTIDCLEDAPSAQQTLADGRGRGKQVVYVPR